MRFRPREFDILALLGLVLCGGVTYTARHTLNADGVSYLDLAARLRQGDWAHFVQGYWSPLYPVLLALASAASGLEGARLIPITHLINWLLVIAAIGVIRLWANRVPGVWFGRAALAALFLCSTGPPRVEAVTPDLLLLAVLARLTYELVVHGGRRWLLVGGLLGAAFLAKTSAWPWLAIAVGVRIWGARDGPGRADVYRSSAVGAALMLLWVVPMSLKDYHFTLGSAGRLNFCWYLEECDSRTPDSHSGGHVLYRDAQLENGARITWAAFDDSDSWTYQPWSDPTTWDRGVLSRSATAPDMVGLLTYWSKLAGLVFGLWLLPLFLAVLLPSAWAGRRPNLGRSLRTEHRSALVVMSLGLLGLGQFIAVHAEPRLIAPFALMLGLGALSWLSAEAPPAGDKRASRPPNASGRWVRQMVTSLGCVVALGFLVARIRIGLDTDQRISAGTLALEQTAARLAAQGVGMGRIAIVGPAMPATAIAYLVGGHIVGQILPRSLQVFASLAQPAQQQVLDALFGGRADVAWLTTAGGGIRIVPVGRAAAH